MKYWPFVIVGFVSGLIGDSFWELLGYCVIGNVLMWFAIYNFASGPIETSQRGDTQ